MNATSSGSTNRAARSIRADRTLGKFLFVNFDPDARPLADELAPFIPQWRQFQFESLRFVRKDRFELQCNWKIAMEANMEVYHVPSIHPTTVSPLLDHRGNVNTLYAGRSWPHGRAVATDARAERRHDGRPDIETVGEIARTCTLSFNLVPNLVSPMSAKGFPVMAFWPTSLNTTTLEISWFGKDWAPARCRRTGTNTSVLQRGRCRRHTIRQLDSEGGRVVCLRRRAAELPGSAHLPLASVD